MKYNFFFDGFSLLSNNLIICQSSSFSYSDGWSMFVFTEKFWPWFLVVFDLIPSHQSFTFLLFLYFPMIGLIEIRIEFFGLIFFCSICFTKSSIKILKEAFLSEKYHCKFYLLIIKQTNYLTNLLISVFPPPPSPPPGLPLFGFGPPPFGRPQ